MALALKVILSVLCAVLTVSAVEILRIIPSEAVALRDPRALSVSSEGLLYIADTGHHRILAVDSNGYLQYETGGFGSGESQFQWPQDIAATYGNAVWIVDFGNRRVVKLSRHLDFQGALTIPGRDSDSPRQPARIAVSPLGDVYIYETDNGELLRYDPLFILQADLGGRAGADFIPRMDNLAYVSDIGLFWHVPGDTLLRSCDAMLTPRSSYQPPAGWKDGGIFTEAENGLFFISMAGIFRVDSTMKNAELLIDESFMRESGINQVNDAAASFSGILYILNSRHGSVYRIRWPEQ